MKTSSWRAFSAGLVGVLAWLAVPSAFADDWAEEGHDAGGSAFNVDQTGLGAGNLGQVVKLWSRTLDVWEQSTAVLLADGQAFAGRKIADAKKTVQQQVVRLDPDTGAFLWKTDLSQEIDTPALTPTLVIAAGDGSRRPDGDTKVWGLDRATGAIVWTYRFGQMTRFEPPHVVDGIVYLVSIDGDTLALDANTGGLVWRHVHHGGCCSFRGEAVAPGVMLVSSYAGLAALSTTDGNPLWEFDLPEGRIADQRPMIVGSTALFFDLDGYVYAFDLATGALKWTAWAHDARKTTLSYGPLATDGQRVFAMTGVVAPTVTALDLATGAELWWTHQPKWAHSPVVSNGVLYLAGLKHLLAFDTATGTQLPMPYLPSNRYGELSIAEGRLMIGGGPVRAYGLK